MQDAYMHVWKMTKKEYYKYLVKHGMTGLQQLMFKLFGATARHMIRKGKSNYRIIIKSIHEAPRFPAKFGEIKTKGLWDYVEKKVGERVKFLVDYVEKDKSGKFLMTYDETEVFNTFINKQINYGIEAESFIIYGKRAFSVKGNPYFSYRMHVIATVTDEVAFMRMQKNGIGRRRSYGNGLVSVGLDPDD